MKIQSVQQNKSGIVKINRHSFYQSPCNAWTQIEVNNETHAIYEFVCKVSKKKIYGIEQRPPDFPRKTKTFAIYRMGVPRVCLITENSAFCLKL